jgi:hypothetical protein
MLKRRKRVSHLCQFRYQEFVEGSVEWVPEIISFLVTSHTSHGTYRFGPAPVRLSEDHTLDSITLLSAKQLNNHEHRKGTHLQIHMQHTSFHFLQCLEQFLMTMCL